MGSVERASPARSQGFSVCGSPGILPAENSSDLGEKGIINVSAMMLEKEL